MNIFNAVLNRGCENNNYIKNVTVTNNSNIIKLELMLAVQASCASNTNTECYYKYMIYLTIVVVVSS